MATKRALQNIFGTQKVGEAILYISPPLLKVGGSALPSSAAPGSFNRVRKWRQQHKNGRLTFGRVVPVPTYLYLLEFNMKPIRLYLE